MVTRAARYGAVEFAKKKKKDLEDEELYTSCEYGWIQES